MTRRDLGPRPLTYPMPTLLVGVYDAEGRPNLMAAAWGGICNSTPPCVSVSIRPSRWTRRPPQPHGRRLGRHLQFHAALRQRFHSPLALDA